MSVLKYKDALGNWLSILTIKGDKGDTGNQGAQGIPGVSPTVTVTDITGGHRVTITDADHPGGISFDVMDGTDADAPVQDVLINGNSIVDANGDAVIPVAGSVVGVPGVVRVSSTFGLQMNSSIPEIIMTQPASADNVKNGNTGAEENQRTYRVITPKIQHQSVFYGLATAASDTSQSSSSNTVGNYTDDAKSKIHEMLSGSISVSGTTPTINALPGLRYICGEVSTLTVNLPASGCVDITFESGSTPTVLTVNPASGQTVKWMGGFDPTNLLANKTYELNINNCLGVVGIWT